MPRNPVYSGSIASQVLPYGAPQRPSIMSQVASAAQGLPGMIEKMMYTPQADPEFQRAQLIGAQADKARAEATAAQNAQTALPKYGAVFQELPERVLPNTDPNAVRRAAAGAFAGFVKDGGDPNVGLKMLQAFGLSVGDDQLMTQINAALDGKYLGDTQSPSYAAQLLKTEDAQAQETALQDSKNKVDMRGQDITSGDRRYVAGVESGDRRYSTDVGASTSRRGQDLNYNIADRKQRADVYYKDYDRNYPVVTGKRVVDNGKGVKTTTEAKRRRPVTGAAPSRPQVKSDPLGIR